MTRTPRPAKIQLTQEQADSLRGSWNGAGGFQTLGPKLAAKINPDLTLELEDDEVGEILRYMNYVRSGFRKRIRDIFGPELTRLAAH